MNIIKVIKIQYSIVHTETESFRVFTNGLVQKLDNGTQRFGPFDSSILESKDFESIQQAGLEQLK